MTEVGNDEFKVRAVAKEESLALPHLSEDDIDAILEWFERNDTIKGLLDKIALKLAEKTGTSRALRMKQAKYWALQSALLVNEVLPPILILAAYTSIKRGQFDTIGSLLAVVCVFVCAANITYFDGSDYRVEAARETLREHFRRIPGIGYESQVVVSETPQRSPRSPTTSGRRPTASDR